MNLQALRSARTWFPSQVMGPRKGKGMCVSMSDKLMVLRELSDRTLQAYELSKRNEAANLAKELRLIEEKIVDARIEAELARIVREMRQQITLTSDAPALPVKPISYEPE